jgi:hypothetical protein
MNFGGELLRSVARISYLFPDGSYFYYVWSDIPPATIRDKRTWAYLETSSR